MLLLTLIIDIIIIIFFYTIWKTRIGRGFSPTALYGIIWGVIWLIHLIDIMGYYKISNRGLVYSVIPLISMGYVELYLIFVDNKKNFFYETEKINAVLFRRWVIALGSISLLIGLTIFIVSLMAFGKDWMIIGRAAEIKGLRVTEGMSAYFSQFKGTSIYRFGLYIPLLQGVSYGSILLSILYLKLINHRYYIGIILPIFGSILYDFGSVSRSYTYHMILFFAVMQFVLPFNKKKPSKHRGFNKPRRVLIGVVFLISFFSMYFISNINRSWEEPNSLFHLSILTPLEMYVNYNTANLVTFDQTLDQNPITYGRMSFFSIESLLRILRIVPRSISRPEQMLTWEEEYPEVYRYKIGGQNTYSWLRYLYSDFGVLGLFIIPLFLGFVTLFFTIKFVRNSKPNIQALAILSICYAVILRSSTIMIFRDTAYFFGFLLLYVATQHIGKKSISPRNGVRKYA